MYHTDHTFKSVLSGLLISKNVGHRIVNCMQQPEMFDDGAILHSSAFRGRRSSKWWTRRSQREESGGERISTIIMPMTRRITWTPMAMACRI